MRKILLMVSLFSMIACKDNNQQKADEKKITETVSIDKKDILSADILTAEQQAALTPQAVLECLKKGNKDFTEDNLTIRNSTERVRRASLGQYPKAVVLSCLDSRVPVEDVFHSGIGNLFVSIEQIRQRSPILKEMEQKGEILIVGAVYNMKTGAVEFLNDL